jgi:hypothetical protein
MLPAERGKLVLTLDGVKVLFRDIPVAEWFARYVATIIREGIASGYKNEQGDLTGFFGPSNRVTYAEIAKMSLLLGGADLTSVSDAPENLSARGQWSEVYIRLAEESDLSIFTPSLQVNDSATRGAVIQTMLEALDIPITEGEENPYKDVPAHHIYKDAILTATNLGIVRGDTNTKGESLHRFRPNDPVNRAEVAKILAEAGNRACALP